MRSILRGAWALHKRKPSAATKGFGAVRVPLLRRRGARRAPLCRRRELFRLRDRRFAHFRVNQRARSFWCGRRLDLSPL